MNKKLIIGITGSGKSTINKIISFISHYKRLDSDEIIENIFNIKIERFLNKKKENIFRNIECKIKIVKKNIFYSLGGGTIMNYSIIIKILKGLCVLRKNCHSKNILNKRTFLKYSNFKKILNQRKKKYNFFKKKMIK